MIGKTYRHNRRGTLYEVLSLGRLQINCPHDNKECVIYQSKHDKKIWVRPLDEFLDGRFQEIPSAACEGVCADCGGLMLMWQGHNSGEGPKLRCINQSCPGDRFTRAREKK